MRDAGLEGHDLPGWLDPSLRAALKMLATDPPLARLLIIDPHLGGDRASLDAQHEWIERLTKPLETGAAGDPRASGEYRSLACFLIAGVCFQIDRLVLKDETSDLPRLLPSLLDCLPSFYFEPGEPYRVARAAVADRAIDASEPARLGARDSLFIGLPKFLAP